jgi:HK97 family phage portal protein
MYVLDPSRVRPLVANDGSVFYELAADTVVGLGERVIVPAREIIHDRFNCLFHPLVGLSPIYACGLASTQGLAIQNNSARFFSNQSRPGGILTAPAAIGDDTAKRLKEHWDSNYGGDNAGRIAVVGDGLKFEALTITAEDAQLIDQLKWTAEVVCSVFHVPPYKIGVGTLPSMANVQALNLEYYTQALQILIEGLELCLDEGLGTGEKLGTELDLDGLLRMDTVTLIQAIKEAVGAGVMAPNEGRRRIDLPPVEGGETPYLQQQNYSLAALAKRDALEDPFGTKAPAPAPPPPPPDDAAKARAFLAGVLKGFGHA